ncbi:hypothetical protein [Nocardia salmonicida]|uniref:hypothetical protein n=1 Tax=Nocardia salmonicida TaxID=53431 RepID=UPI0033F101F6
MEIPRDYTPDASSSDIEQDTSNIELEHALQCIRDIVAIAYDEETIEQRTDAYLKAHADSNPRLMAEILFELATSEESRLQLIAADNVGVLYAADPELGRVLWELMVTTEGTRSDAQDMLTEHIFTDKALSSRETEDFAAIERIAMDWQNRQG